jgi:CheY-like chemotaxis protein
VAGANERRSVLVIEDDPGIRESIVECLAAEGYEVAGARNGAEGLERLRAGCVGLVVLDLVMPVMNGAEFLAAAAREGVCREVPVLIMTAALPREHERLPGAAGYLPKPFELGELLDAVARHCAPAP